MSILQRLINYNGVSRTGTSPDSALIPIAYNNSNFQTLGRWNDTGSGVWSGWNGSRIIFKLTGTGQLTIIASVVDADAATLTGMSVFIDREFSGRLYEFTSQTEVFTGTRSVTIPIPNNGAAHTIELMTSMYGPSCFATTQKVTITAMLSGSLAVVSAVTTAPKLIQCIGDSWIANINSWARLMDPTRYRIYAVANSSYKVSDLDAGYDYDYSGHLNTTDPVCDAAVISEMVNSYTAGVSLAAYRASMLSLIDRVRIKQPGIPIFLIRVPNNGASLYSQYGTECAAIAAGLRTNVTYVNNSTIDSLLTWADPYHLSGSSLDVMRRAPQDALLAAGI